MGTILLTVSDLQDAVSRHLGYQRDYDNDDAVQKADVDAAVDSGLREVYFHRFVEEGETVPHVWSFMRRSEELTLTADQYQYSAPTGFHSLLDSPTFAADSERPPLDVITDEELRALQANEEATNGVPKYVSVDPYSHALNLSPTPDDAYVLTYRFVFTPTDDATVLGGVEHSELFLESCLASADKLFNIGGDNKQHAELFAILLQAAIKADKELTDVKGRSLLWPILATEPDDYNITKAYLNRLIGRQLGYGPNPANWSHGQSAEITEVRRGGLRKFYQPAVLEGETYGHEWSFLSPVAILDLVGGESTYDLPDDFSMVTGPMSFEPDESVLYRPIQQIGESQLRHLNQRSIASSRPTVFAIRPKEFNENYGTRYEILFSPVPEQEYTLNYPYCINPSLMSADDKLPVGGQPHAQTIIEACLAEAEIVKGKGGIHQKEFAKCLKTSISHDRQASSPDFLGYNSDESDGRSMFSNWHDLDENIVTYEGVEH